LIKEREKAMKAQRHAKILDLIEQNDVETQEELLGLLQENGFEVTQATISRDIRTLHLMKSTDGNGKHKYTRGMKGVQTRVSTAKYVNILGESLASVDTAVNLIVVKTYSGMANAAAAAIDALGFATVVGSIAGDDTIFLAMRSSESAVTVAAELSAMIKHH